MKYLITLLFVTLFSSQLIAESINECKTDIYFANGVGATSYDKSFNQGRNQVRKYEIATPSTQPFIGKYDLAFNTGHGVILDFFEAWLQYTDENPSAKLGWDAFQVAMGRATVVGGSAIELSKAVARKHESDDISKQVKAYENSIKLGHGVLVLAHSQGNFFTNKAYSSDGGIAPWMRDYFKTVGLASPSDVKIPHSSYLTYDNDPISVLNGAGEIIRNPMRYYVWLPGPNAIVDSTSTIPCTPITIPDGTTPMCNAEEWYSEDSSLSDFHEFDYYMQTPATQTDIYKYLTEAIEFHNSIHTASQWETDQELNKGTKDYKITVKHRFDSSVVMSEEVYPFAPSKKLYQVLDNTGGNGWIKASCGGSEVFDSWTNQQDNQFYLINNPQEEKIVKVGDYSYDASFSFSRSHNTCNKIYGNNFYMNSTTTDSQSINKTYQTIILPISSPPIKIICLAAVTTMYTHEEIYDFTFRTRDYTKADTLKYEEWYRSLSEGYIREGYSSQMGYTLNYDSSTKVLTVKSYQKSDFTYIKLDIYYGYIMDVNKHIYDTRVIDTKVSYYFTDMSDEVVTAFTEYYNITDFVINYETIK